MNRQLQLVAVAGYLTGPADQTVAGPAAFSLGPAEAAVRALRDLTEAPVESSAIQGAHQSRPSKQQSPYEFYETRLDANLSFKLGRPVRVKPVLFHLVGQFVPAYYIEADVELPATEDFPISRFYSYVISAVDGQLLLRNNLTAYDAFSYRVWADTTGLKAPFDNPHGNDPTPNASGVPGGPPPPFVTPNLVTLQNGPISTNDPWLPPDATTTVGNNVEAFADLSPPNGFTPGSSDTFAFTTSPNVFDRIFDPTRPPQENQNQIQAAVTQLFYDINWFHDWYYDSGFKEADGNAQVSNYGRGGLEGDGFSAQAQDFDSQNNASIAIPADGFSPHMQMGLFRGETLTSVTATGGVTGSFSNGNASFGPSDFNVTAAVSPTIPANGCGGITNNLAGKIAFIDRGICTFAEKVKNAQLAGAVGVIIANVASSFNPGTPPFMPGVDPTITIGALSLNFSDGNLFRASLGIGEPITAVLFSLASFRDSTLDNQVVAHEWGHFINLRLVSIHSNMAFGLSEGWADFHALLLIVKQEDSAVASNSTFDGIYTVGSYATDDYYFGVRRVPYSTDFAKDPLTFKHIANGVPLPTGVPIAFGQNGSNNAEVHNTGEIWATMLWECYAALLRDTLGPNPRLTFEEAQNRMKDYLVAAYKMTPPEPTLLEARDALLAVALVADSTDYLEFWQAFAKRGAGINAVAPDRFSETNTPGLVESFDLVSVQVNDLTDSVVSCDHDGFLDNGEQGQLRLSLRNVGSVPLSATTAKVTTTNPNVSFPDGNVINLTPTPPIGVTTASVTIALNGAVGLQQIDFVVSVNDPALNPATPGTAGLSTYANADIQSAASASDSVKSPLTSWTPGVALGSGLFARTQIAITPLNSVWAGPDLGAPADRSLVSPNLAVGPGNFSFSFSHRFAFESAGTVFFDGGVIEISTDGVNWTDIGSGYTQTLVFGGSNPLAGRQAYAGLSAGYPAFATQNIDLGTIYANQNVRVRFRIGEDDLIGGPGWDIDDLVFTGLTNTPFTALIASQVDCQPNLVAAGSALVNESCPPVNNAIDPGERVTVTLNLVNNGAGSSNLVATLQSGSGVVAPTAPQSYGAMAPGATVGRDFGFTVAGTCGGLVTATLQLQDGSNNLGTVTYNLRLGVNTPNGFVCTSPCGGVRMVTTSALTRINASTVQALITVQNIGSDAANDVTLTTAKLGAANGTPLPQGLGNLAPGGLASVLVNFTNSTPGAPSSLTAGGIYAGGTFSSSKRVTIP
ncbi:MAG: M36 family metallopeptidase [Pyrinomonadaceae bacterium]|nr:M36 family metallopeptidase [Pyrinomonadaceae bacterium]